jgi:DNA polymerase III epsilon subunit-like protein
MLYNNIIVWDAETGGKDPKVCDPIQIGAMVINPHSLQFVCDEKGKPVYFNSMMRPENMDNIQDEALAVNKKTREEIEAAPLEEVVFKNFVNWTKQFNYKKDNNQWSAPISAGFNILNFDMVLLDRLCNKYGFLNKEGKQNIFHKIYTYDLMNICVYWHNGQKMPDKYNLGALSKFYGIDNTGAHDALVDVQITGEILIKFLKLAQTFHKKVKSWNLTDEN